MTTFLKTHGRFWIAPLLLGGGLILVTVILFASTPSAAKPPVTWTPSSVLEAVPAGQSVTVPVSLTASRNLTDMVVRIAPELQPFVDVDQPVLGDINEGETVVLIFTISMSAGALPETIEGVAQLRTESAPNKTFGSPLPFTIVVLEQLFLNIGNPTVFPSEILTNTPADIVVRMKIAHPDVVSAEIIEVDEVGQYISTLGFLNDDGSDGDDVIGDEQYAGTIFVTEPSPGQIRVSVEVTVGGASPVRSGIAFINVIQSMTKKWSSASSSLFQIKYPPGWTAAVNSDTDRVVLVAPGTAGPEFSGDVTIDVLANPDSLSMEEYFNGVEAINYFEDAIEINDITVHGIPTKEFRAVPSIGGGVDVVIVPGPGVFIVITDVIGTMLFDTIVETFELI